jgi:hypothetical protein
MSATEIASFLATQSTVVIAALDDGAPTGTVAGAYYHAGTLTFALREEDPVVPLLAVDPRVCCIAEEFPSYFEIKGVAVHGIATRVRDAVRPTFVLPVEDVTSFDFSKLQAP